MVSKFMENDPFDSLDEYADITSNAEKKTPKNLDTRKPANLDTWIPGFPGKNRRLRRKTNKNRIKNGTLIDRDLYVKAKSLAVLHGLTLSDVFEDSLKYFIKKYKNKGFEL